MFRLSDFFYLPQVEPLVKQFTLLRPGLLVIAGLDARTVDGGGGPGFLPSGRAAIFRVLFDELMTTHPGLTAIAICKEKFSVPRKINKRVDFWKLRQEDTYDSLIGAARHRRPGLLIIDQLNEDNSRAALDAAHRGLMVLAQMDTVFHGAGVARHLVSICGDGAPIAGLKGVLSIQRLPTLCDHCKQPVEPDRSQFQFLTSRFTSLKDLAADCARFYQTGGCGVCGYSGRQGDTAIFDIYRYPAEEPNPFRQPSLLAMEDYVAQLALDGKLALDDVLEFEQEQVRRTYFLFASSERALVEANAANQRRLVQLEAANKVLRQRTEALISLESIGQTLITTTGLNELAAQVCRSARDLCGAERGILYYQRAPDQVEVLAVTGWDPVLLHRTIPPDEVFPPDLGADPAPFHHLPPGVPSRFIDAQAPRIGLAVPLIAQDVRAGLMIIHTGSKLRFTPGEVALLKTFANQVALALQRAGLIDQLRAKIAELEVAQVELAHKERLEQEMALARQVQQSVLPRTFPEAPGYSFAARNEPARQVGGDFYDVIDLDEDHFGLAIGDVSDKGMPAALYMALTRSLLRAEARRELSPAGVVTSVNHLLQELGEPDMFVTVFYGVVERATRRMTFVRAGHDHPFLLRGGQAVDLPGNGPALGLLDNEQFVLSEEQVNLDPGDSLVLYTDGLVDVLSVEDEMYDRKRLQALLESCSGLAPDDFCAAVFERLAAFSGSAGQYDDMTLLVMHVEA
jgi:serine phosphatase RsbU (regulator of sigma subunit)